MAEKKSLVSLTHPKRIALLERSSDISLSSQAALLDISRQSIYYRPRVSAESVRIRHAIDEIYTKHPFFGSRRIRDELQVTHGTNICRDQVRQHMREMGLEAVYPKKNTSFSHPNHPIFPYLLRGLRITKPNQVWGTDITYIRLNKDFCYLVAFLDWYSRYVVSWALSPTLEIEFCLDNLERALKTKQPDIHNSDQGSHFISLKYTDILKTR